jgi:transposase
MICIGMDECTPCFLWFEIDQQNCGHEHNSYYLSPRCILLPKVNNEDTAKIGEREIPKTAYASKPPEQNNHKKGIKIMQIVAMTGLSHPTVRATIDLFDAGGWAGIRPALRGRNKGDGHVLSQAQEDAIQRMIIDKRPEQLKMDFSLWSRAAVGQLIEQEFGIKLQVRSIGKYLTRWGFTPQKPIKRAYEQNPAAVQAWLEGEYPAIEQRMRLQARHPWP